MHPINDGMAMIFHPESSGESFIGMTLRAARVEHRFFRTPSELIDCVTAIGSTDLPACIVIIVERWDDDCRSLISQLKRLRLVNRIPVICLPEIADVHSAVAALQEGAFDFQLRSVEFTLVLSQLQKALVASTRVAEDWAAQRQVRRRVASLAQRSLDVMQLIVEGKPNKDIAKNLQISVRTVEVHRAIVFDKLGVRGAVQLSNSIHLIGSKIDIANPTLSYHQ